MGSYASVAPVLAARMLRVPIALHESNVIPGRAAGFLARFASAVAVAFPETRGRWHHPHIVWTGLPVRTPTGRCFPGAALSPGVFTVLFMGGSQGAHRLNELATEALRALHREGLPFQVVHLAGFEDRDPVERRYQEAGIRHLVFDFLADIEQAYRAADLAVCRAGAATCGELAAFGVPALLVPYPAAISGHQLENAKAMEAGGAADVVEQRDLTSARLAEYIRHAQRHPEKREAMKNALKSRAALDAADRLATLVEDVARSRHQGCGQRPS
jgi:UDP-N-acetylglucosamine--N-acetylmuramyl-(pentapeptide) pyrophosphoryl-undecaprenol N-acetylglucosamine transferase